MTNAMLNLAAALEQKEGANIGDIYRLRGGQDKPTTCTICNQNEAITHGMCGECDNNFYEDNEMQKTETADPYRKQVAA